MGLLTRDWAISGRFRGECGHPRALNGKVNSYENARTQWPRMKFFRRNFFLGSKLIVVRSVCYEIEQIKLAVVV